MPIAIFAIGLSIFALTTTEFVISGLLPLIATDLGISIPQGGMLVSAFAIAMVVAPPFAAAASLRLPRKPTLIALLVVFAASQALTAMAPGFGVLLAARVLAGLAAASFFAVGATTAVALVAEHLRGRAIAVVMGGLALATILGVPVGTFLGQAIGWRATFWAIAGIALLALASIAVLLRPVRAASAESPRLGAELRGFADRRVWIALSITFLTQGAIFATYSYAAPYLTEVAGAPESAVPTILLLFGLGGFAGLTLGGRAADWRPLATLAIGINGLIAVFAVLWLAPAGPVVAGAAILLLGFFGLLINPSLSLPVFALLNGSTFAGASSTSAFNVGNTIGPWLGGLTIGAGLGLGSPIWVSLLFLLAAMGMLGLASTQRPFTETARSTPIQAREPAGA